MPIQPEGMPQGVGAVVAIVYLLFMLGMIISYIIVLIALWRGMKAHEKIAAKLGEIAEKLQLR